MTEPGSRIPAWSRSQRRIFDEYMPTPNQIRPPSQAHSRITEQICWRSQKARITSAGFERNIDVALQYIESWLRGNGCVPIYNLMEDAATAEISRAQLWQWLSYGAKLENGQQITPAMLTEVLNSILERARTAMGAEDFAASKFTRAAELLTQFCTGDFQEFLTTAAYAEFA